jgi:excisionase family DNA binding protein
VEPYPAMKRAPADPELLTTEEVMERLLADESLRRSAARCVLPAVRCGTEWRFRKRDLEAWIERHRAGMPPLPLA